MMNRRQMIRTGLAGLSLAAIPLSAVADDKDVQAALQQMFGDRDLREGRVTLTLPPIAENGFSVPLDVSVESPMTQENHVKRIAIFAPGNPLPVISQFHLTPRSGVAKVSTRIRMGSTQTMLAVAEMSDGTLWSGTAVTLVTLAACVII